MLFCPPIKRKRKKKEKNRGKKEKEGRQYLVFKKVTGIVEFYELLVAGGQVV